MEILPNPGGDVNEFCWKIPRHMRFRDRNQIPNYRIPVRRSAAEATQRLAAVLREAEDPELGNEDTRGLPSERPGHPPVAIPLRVRSLFGESTDVSSLSTGE